MNNFAKIEDVEKLWRSLTEDEKERAKNLLPIVEDSLRMEADKVGKNLDRMIEEKPYLENVAIEKIIGPEQKEQLKEHVRDEAGRVSIKRMFDEIGEILRGNQEGKNS